MSTRRKMRSTRKFLRVHRTPLKETETSTTRKQLRAMAAATNMTKIIRGRSSMIMNKLSESLKK
jgi:hypothetical protein